MTSNRFVLLVLTLCVLTIHTATAEALKIGLLRSSGFAPFFIADDRGYFKDEGLAAELVFFEAPQNLPTATVAGSVQIAGASATAAFFNLAGQGALRIIAGGSELAPGFHDWGAVASNTAYASGLTQFKDLPGHTTAGVNAAGPAAYSLKLIADKYGFSPSTVRIVLLPSIPASATAILGGSVESGINATSVWLPAMARGDMKLVGYIGDEVQWQLSIIYTTAKLADAQPETVRRFLQAYKRGAKAYHDAITASDERPSSSPDQSVLALIARYVGQSTTEIAETLAYQDPEGRLDIADVLRQLAWHREQGTVKPGLPGEQIIDTRYVLPTSSK